MKLKKKPFWWRNKKKVIIIIVATQGSRGQQRTAEESRGKHRTVRAEGWAAAAPSKLLKKSENASGCGLKMKIQRIICFWNGMKSKLMLMMEMSKYLIKFPWWLSLHANHFNWLTSSFLRFTVSVTAYNYRFPDERRISNSTSVIITQRINDR